MNRSRAILVLVFVSAVSACGTKSRGNPAMDSSVDSVVRSVPLGSGSPDSVADGEDSFQCLVAQQDVAATFGMDTDARRVALKMVFSELSPPANERVKVYQTAVKRILDSENSDLTLVDTLVC